MNWTPADLKAQLEHAKGSGVYGAAVASAANHGLDLAVWLAVGSRESNLRDVTGDHGHGRGPWQLDDRSHDIPRGLAALASASAAVLVDALQQAAEHGLTGDAALKVGLSAYNCGFANAWAGHLHGDSDQRTTGGDYAADVLQRTAVFRALLGK